VKDGDPLIILFSRARFAAQMRKWDTLVDALAEAWSLEGRIRAEDPLERQAIAARMLNFDTVFEDILAALTPPTVH
jgi:hypothetical protein